MYATEHWWRQLLIAIVVLTLGIGLRATEVVMVNIHENGHMTAAREIGRIAERSERTRVVYTGGFDATIHAAGYRQESIVATIGVAGGLLIFILTLLSSRIKPQAWLPWFWIGILIYLWASHPRAQDYKDMIDNAVGSQEAWILMYGDTLFPAIVLIILSVALWFIPGFRKGSFISHQTHGHTDAGPPGA